MSVTLYDRLRNARKYLHLSQEFVATQIGLSRTAITAIELGQRNISSEELKKISELYGVTFDELIYGEDANADVKVFARLYSELPETDRMEIQNLIEFKRSYKKHNGNLR